MQSLKTLRALGTVDALSLSRDSLLRGMIILPLGLAIAARWLFPPVVERSGTVLPFDLESLYPQLMSYVLLVLAPVICGAVVGFMLLDQRDDNTLTALEVTPLPLTSYLAYRLSLPVGLSFLMTLIALPLSGLLPVGMLDLLILALAAAPLAPMTALFLGAFAANKVQGFALQKALSVFFIAPFLGSLLPVPLNMLLGLLPTYWPAALLWEIQETGVFHWITLLVGLVYQVVLLVLLLRRFQRVMYR